MAQMVNGGWYNGQQYWNGQLGAKGVINNPNQQGYGQAVSGAQVDPNWNPSGGNNGGGGGGQSMPSQADIDNAFSGVYSGLDAATKALSGNRDSALQTAQQEENNATGLIPGQQKQLEDTLTSSKNNWAQGTQSAYADALSAYNALQQRNMGLFGGQSSAAQAANDFLNQEYLRTKGQIGNQDMQAQLQFNGENQNIANWVADTTMKIKNWYLDASQQINNQFAQGMAQINEQRGQTDTDKAMAKLNLVSTLVQHQQALDTMNQQFQQYAQLAATTGIPSTQAYSQQGFLNNINGYLGNVNNAVGGFSASANITPSFNAKNYQTTPVGPIASTNKDKYTNGTLPGLSFGSSPTSGSSASLR